MLPLGLGDAQLAPVGLVLGPGAHALVAGPPRSGKSTTLLSLVAVAQRSRPDVAISAIALGLSPLAEAPDLARVASTTDEIASLVAAIGADERPHLLVIDDADLIDDEGGEIARLLAARRPDVHAVIAGRPDSLRGRFGHFTQEVRRSRQGVILRPDRDVDGDLLAAALPRRGPARFEAGRGYLVHDGQCQLVQCARAVPVASG
jgi:S-DNA-T family DNA segregation ATPase FtsK/SpoIIIE